MTRTVRVAAGQLGPIQRDHSREQVVVRLLDLLHQAADAGCAIDQTLLMMAAHEEFAKLERSFSGDRGKAG